MESVNDYLNFMVVMSRETLTCLRSSPELYVFIIFFHLTKVKEIKFNTKVGSTAVL